MAVSVHTTPPAWLGLIIGGRVKVGSEANRNSRFPPALLKIATTSLGPDTPLTNGSPIKSWNRVVESTSALFKMKSPIGSQMGAPSAPQLVTAGSTNGLGP